MNRIIVFFFLISTIYSPVYAQNFSEILHIIDRNGAVVHANPDADSETFSTLEYGRKVEVLKTEGEWILVVSHTQKDSQQGYIQKSQTGRFNEVKLIADDLHELAFIYRTDRETTVETDSITSELKLELVDKSVYLASKANAVNFLKSDTTEIQKKDGIIKLKTKQKTRIFKDIPEITESIQTYYYVGQLEALNAYLIYGVYWEDADYTLINKTSGEEVQTFVDFPYISADQKHVVAIYPNPYDVTADFQFSRIKKKRPEVTYTASFKNWIPATETDEIFWTNDHFLYIPVVHSAVYWDDSGNINSNVQYIRIKVIK